MGDPYCHLQFRSTRATAPLATEFAHGVSLDEYQTRTHMVVEGAVAARSVSELARSLGVTFRSPLPWSKRSTTVLLWIGRSRFYRSRPFSRVLRTHRLAQKGYYHGFHQNRPSVLSADMANPPGGARQDRRADYVHFDVMDGHFTGNPTFGVDILKAVKALHRCTGRRAPHGRRTPDETVDWYADAGADMITVHYEASTHLHRTLTHLQQRGVKARRGAQPRYPRACSRASSTLSTWCC